MHIVLKIIRNRIPNRYKNWVAFTIGLCFVWNCSGAHFGTHLYPQNQVSHTIPSRGIGFGWQKDKIEYRESKLSFCEIFHAELRSTNFRTRFSTNKGVVWLIPLLLLVQPLKRLTFSSVPVKSAKKITTFQKPFAWLGGSYSVCVLLLCHNYLDLHSNFQQTCGDFNCFPQQNVRHFVWLGGSSPVYIFITLLWLLGSSSLFQQDATTSFVLETDKHTSKQTSKRGSKQTKKCPDPNRSENAICPFMCLMVQSFLCLYNDRKS